MSHEDDFSWLPDPEGRGLSFSPMEAAALRGEAPTLNFLPKDYDRAAWGRVLSRLSGREGLAWTIFAKLRAGKDVVNKAAVVSSWPPSKKRRELFNLFDTLSSRVDVLIEIRRTASKENTKHYDTAIDHLILSIESIISIVKTETNQQKNNDRPTVSSRNAFIESMHDLLASRLDGFSLRNNEDFNLLVDICLTSSVIKRKADFPYSLKKRLANS